MMLGRQENGRERGDLAERLAAVVDTDEEAAPGPPPIAPLDEALADARQQERASRKRRREEAELTQQDEEDTAAAAAAERQRVLRALHQRRDPFPLKCFLCSYGDVSTAARNPAFVTLVNMVKGARNCNDKQELCRRACNYYLRQLWAPAEGTPDELPLQSPEDFLDHLERHTLNPGLKVAQLQELVFDALDDVRLNYKNDRGGASKIASLGTLAVRLLTIPRNGTFFGQHGDPLEIDAGAIGEVANIRAVQPLLRSQRQNTIGGATATDTGAAEAARAPRRQFGTAPVREPVV